MILIIYGQCWPTELGREVLEDTDTRKEERKK